MEEIILENRNDLSEYLKDTDYDFVVLKFSAEWCKPCKIVKPIIENTLKRSRC